MRRSTRTSSRAAAVNLVADLAVALGGGLQMLPRELARLLPQLLRHHRLLCPLSLLGDGRERRRGLGFGCPSFSWRG